MTAEPQRPADSLRDLEIDDIIKALTLEEKVAMMSGSGFYRIHSDAKKWGAKPYPAGAANERLGIEGLKFSDGPRGVVVGHSTCFPCSMARGASFDRDLEWRIGEAMALEARAQGVNLLGQVCVNLLRHPAWGRAQETYGEDSYHLGEMGSALSQGSQHHNVISTVKHYALNSLENTRFELNVRVDERTLREIYLPHFRKVIEDGCLSVMSAYNKVNGGYCGQNAYLLTEILRDEWGFEGFVHSDWVLGVYSPHGAEAGLDIENPEPAWFGEKLLSAVNSGAISEDVIDTAVRRMLSVLKAVTLKSDPRPSYPLSLVACDEHTQLAREAAEKSAVLLKNDALLPLDGSTIVSIGVFGQLANLENTGDRGSSRVTPPYIVTPFEGLQAHLGEDRILFGGDETDPLAAGRAAANHDAAIVVVGYTAIEEGEYIPNDINLGQEDIPENLAAILDGVRGHGPERPIGGDRFSLSLPTAQIELIRAVAAANPRTVVVLVAGSAVMVEEWVEDVPAIMQTFYAGMEGGRALARLLFGEVSPSGRLPFTVAKDPRNYPAFDPRAKEIEYEFWHGYARFQRNDSPTRYPFGHGLSYSSFAYSGLTAHMTEDGFLEAFVTVTNTGARKAIDTPQLYIEWPGQAAERQKASLKGFVRVELGSGESKRIGFAVSPRDLAWYDTQSKSWKTEAGEHRVRIGCSADDKAGPSVVIDFGTETDLGI